MRIYYNGSAPNISVTVAPAAHLSGELPAQWRDEHGEPVNLSVGFRNGEAVVDSELGRYLVAQKIARSSRLIMPGLLRA